MKQTAVVFTADAAKLKMKDGSVGKIVTNMPWGKQIKVENIHQLYRDFLKQVKRILTAPGRAVILTDQTALVEGICDELELVCRRMAELSLHGLHPVVFEITR